MFKAGVLTISDKGSKGERIDISGDLIKSILLDNNYIVCYQNIIPDDTELIVETLLKLCDDEKLDLILTTGGTGFSPRDNTPEATRRVIEREAPGIAYAMISESLKITPKAMLSRAVAGIRNRTLIVNLPGSPKAVKENLNVVLPVLKHGLEILTSVASECGSEK